MKILDAVNYGTPFISTSIGALGMGFEDGRDCFIADTAEDFTQKLLLLIQDEGLRKRFYDSSFQVFTKKYSIQAVSYTHLDVYKRQYHFKRMQTLLQREIQICYLPVMNIRIFNPKKCNK